MSLPSSFKARTPASTLELLVRLAVFQLEVEAMTERMRIDSSGQGGHWDN
jgi:hypothetical protein